jgi:candicidin polyketide synthase FscE
MAPWRALDALGPVVAGALGDAGARGGSPVASPAAVVVADLDWERFGPRYAEARHRPLIDELVTAGDPLDADRAFSPEDLARLGPDAAEAALRALVTGHLATVLGHDPADIAVDRDFAEVGLDSLRGLELRNRLSRALGRRLPVTLALEHPTPRSLARSLFEILTTEPHEEARS